MRTTLRNILCTSLIASAMVMVEPLSAQISRPTPNFGGSRDNGAIHRRENPGNFERQGNNRVVNRTDNSSSSRPSKPGSDNNRRPNFGNDRNDNRGNNGNRPNFGNGNSRPNRPGNDGFGNNGNRPNPGNNSRPSRPGNEGHRPGNPNNRPAPKPGFSYERPGSPAPRPGFSYGRPGTPPPPPHHAHNWGRPVPPPQRPYRPIGRPIPRPVPVYGYRPYASAPVISSILGLTFGTLYSATLDYLYNGGYEIDGYIDNTIYLRNVRELAYNWPDATIYYDTYGRLSSAQFIYSTSYNLLSRYDRLYSDLCRTYGPPVTSNYSGFTRAITWYGGDARGFVTLEYDYSNGRYYTILSYGN